jgi:hypothetical protein
MVLNCVQLVREIGFMVVVHHGKRRDDVFIPVNGFLDEAFPNQVTDGLRAVLVTTPGDDAVELFE